MELFSFPFLFPSYCHSCFSMKSSSHCSDVSTLSSMLASPLPPSFLGTYSLSTSSLGCNALCMVISFLVLWFICLSSSLVHLRKGPENLTRGTAQVFIPSIRFLLESFVSSSFLVLLIIIINIIIVIIIIILQLVNLFVWVLWHINLCWLFNDKSIFIQINSSISNNSV